MLISIILPLGGEEPYWIIKKCLDALKKQTNHTWELIILGREETLTKYNLNKKEIEDISAFNKIITLKEFSTKSEARNKGASLAGGDYLIHIDADTYLEEKALEKMILLANKKIDTATVTQQILNAEKTYWSACRDLEGRIIETCPQPIPIIFKRDIWKQMQGYNEKIDPLDDLGIKIKQRELNINVTPSNIIVKVTPWNCSHPNRAWKRMFARGKAWAKIENFDWSEELKEKAGRNCSNLFRKPEQLIHLPGLFFLKIIDVTAFLLGFTKERIKQKGALQYKNPLKAKRYDKERQLTNYQKYKDYKEKKILRQIIDRYKISSAVEFGCGTGRITKCLIKKGVCTIPTDFSDAMLAEYENKKNLPAPRQMEADNTNIKDSAASASIAVRVLWHAPDKQKLYKIVKEMNRVASSYIIADILTRKSEFNFARIQNTVLTKKEIWALAKNNHWYSIKLFPLEVLPPIWFNFLTKKQAEKLFDPWIKFEKKLARYFGARRCLFLGAKQKEQQKENTN